jgi:hypothetical protein
VTDKNFSSAFNTTKAEEYKEEILCEFQVICRILSELNERHTSLDRGTFGHTTSNTGCSA